MTSVRLTRPGKVRFPALESTSSLTSSIGFDRGPVHGDGVAINMEIGHFAKENASNFSAITRRLG